MTLTYVCQVQKLSPVDLKCEYAVNPSKAKKGLELWISAWKDTREISFEYYFANKAVNLFCTVFIILNGKCCFLSCALMITPQGYGGTFLGICKQEIGDQMGTASET